MADWAEIKNSVTEMFAVVSSALPSKKEPDRAQKANIPKRS